MCRIVREPRVVQVKFAISAFDWCRYKLRRFDWGHNLLRPCRSWYINKISLALRSQRRRASSSRARHIRHKRLVLACEDDWMSLISIHSRLLFVNHSPKSQQFRDIFVISSSLMFGLLREVGNPKSRREAIKGWKCQVLTWRSSKSLGFFRDETSLCLGRLCEALRDAYVTPSKSMWITMQVNEAYGWTFNRNSCVKSSSMMKSLR